MIKGVGIDIAHIPRFTKILEKYEVGFINKVLHKKEIDEYKDLNDIKRKSKYIASRWAYKEALVKASGFKNIIFNKVYLEKNQQGKPFLKIEEE
jgi:holo-[acyl-carrier protein] synthase